MALFDGLGSKAGQGGGGTSLFAQDSVPTNPVEEAYAAWRDGFAVAAYSAARMRTQPDNPCPKFPEYASLYETDPYPNQSEHDLVQAWYSGGCTGFLAESGGTSGVKVGHLIAIGLIHAMDLGRALCAKKIKSSSNGVSGVPPTPTGVTLLSLIVDANGKPLLQHQELYSLLTGPSSNVYRLLFEPGMVAGYNYEWRIAKGEAVPSGRDRAGQISARASVDEEGAGVGTWLAIALGIVVVGGGGYYAWSKYSKKNRNGR